jgi:uncharacterized protein YlxW (UPF0749 family)
MFWSPFTIKIQIKMKIKLERLTKELSKGTAIEQYQALKELKSFVVSSLEKEQQGLQSSVSGLQDLVNEINGNIYGNIPSGD